MQSAIVHLVTNTVNGKRYVGLTRYSIAKRWSEHKGCAAAGKRTALYAAVRKYGLDAFVVEHVASCLSLRHATGVERAVIQSVKPEYNMTNGGEFTLGKRVLSKESAERIRLAHVGKVITKEQREAISKTLKDRYSSDPIFKAAAVASLATGRANVDRAKQKTASSVASASRIWTDESRQKLSASRMGIRNSQESIDRMAAKKNKQVECTTLCVAFDSASEAAQDTGIHVSTISKVCLGKLRTAHGLHFSYV